ncbi:uncharacterized protein LOC117739418 isoform X2 [Cyclopterus lumpus]|uniref:uncharacterized protein LOC117739418 isoform X2 n=1 Tax=Cyclopterus lumpus TaxID=8103 RepID=UPI0014875B89|nr:uncharacterized protein LOC117739418 isoform X2 [Cyclopterus lumpus]
MNNWTPFNTDKPVRVNNTKTMMPAGNPRVTATPKHFACALAPFPRSTWIHPLVPHDNFDRVCKNIWRRASEAEQALGGGGQRSPGSQRNRARRAPDDDTPSHRAEEQQKEASDLGLRSRYEEDKWQYHEAFTLPCPYLSGQIHPHVAKPARELNPVIKEEMKRNEEGKENVSRPEDDAGDKQSSVANSVTKIWLPRSSSSVDKQSSAPENQPPVTNPVCSAAEGRALCPGDEEDPPLAPCKSEDVKDTSGSCDSNSSDDDSDSVTLPGVRSRGTDDSDDDSERGNSDCDEEENKIPYSINELRHDREQDSPSSCTEEDFAPPSTIKCVILPCATELPASGKMHSQWEIPLLFCPHDIPTATFANDRTAHAPVQGKAPQANSRNNAAAAAAPTQQEAYDLLADFPALQPSKKPLALGVFRDGNPKTKGAEGKGGHTRSQNQCQESRAFHERRMANVSHKVSSICRGDHKYLLDLQTFDQGISPAINCEELKANNQPPPRVAATDGVAANGRSWACAAKAGMTRAAAPQEIGRPYTLQQIVAINRAKAKYSAAQNFPNQVVPCCHGPRAHNQKPVRPDYPPTYQKTGIMGRLALKRI